jgi:hypothetical protein
VLDTTAWAAHVDTRTLATVPARGHAHVASYELRSRLPDLLDVTGDPIAALELPCAVHPERWSADAPVAVRRQSTRACRCCPALAPCDQMRRALGPAARGVLAGVDCVRTYTATCQVCGAEFTAQNYQGRYCSDLCRATAHAATARAKRSRS